MRNVFESNQLRYFFSISIALVAALIINHYYAITNGFLIPLTAIYVMQTPIGNSFYQGMRRLILIFMLVAIASFIVFSMRFFYLIMHDVVIGAMMGVFANVIILPRRADIEFRKAVLSLVKGFNDYFMSNIDLLLKNEVVDKGNATFETNFQTLPAWVYEAGFDNGLQVGYRFFLVKLEQITDVLFAMHHLARHDYDKELIAKIRLPLLQCAEEFSQFLSAILAVLELKKAPENVSDLEKEVTELEKQFQAIVPLSLELLDMKRDYVYLSEFVFCFKDLRKLLMKLAEALR